jgi:dTMP kinase
VLDLPAPLGLARAAARRDRAESADRFEAERGNYHQRLREAFLLIAAAEPRRCVVIAADREPDAVEEAIWQAVEARLLGDASIAVKRAAHGG